MPELRTLARLARRNVRRSPGRSALVVFVIALTVGAGVLVAGLNRTYSTSDAQQDQRFFGAAAARFSEHRDPSPPEFVIPDLWLEGGDGVTSFVEVHGFSVVGQHASFSTIDLEHPLTEGILDLVDGRAPQQPGEVALTRAVLDLFDVEIGDDLDGLGALGGLVGIDGVDGSSTVVGEVRHPWSRTHREVVVAPNVIPSDAGSRVWLLDDEIAERSAQRGIVSFRAEHGIASFDGNSGLDLTEPEQLSTAVSGALMLEAAVVAAAAFAVGTRRRVTEFGQLAVVGASDRQLRTLVLLESMVLAVVAVAIGVAVGLLGLVLGSPWWSRAFGRWDDGVRWSAIDSLGPATVGLLAALIAVWIPARTVARLAPAQALAGRFPAATFSPRLLTVGLALIAGGLGLFALLLADSGTSDPKAVLMVASMVAVFIGTAICAGPLLGLVGRRLSGVGGLARLVARDSARQPVRAGASVAALLIVAAVPVIAATIAISDEQLEQDRRHLDDEFVHVFESYEFGVVDAYRALSAFAPDLDVGAAIGDSLRADPDVEVESFAVVTLGLVPLDVGGYPSTVSVGIADETVMDTLEFDDDARVAIASGEWVRASGREPCAPFTCIPAGGGRIGAELPNGRDEWPLPSYFVSADTAVALPGGEFDQVGTIYRLAAPLTEAQRIGVANTLVDALTDGAGIEAIRGPLSDEERTALTDQLAAWHFGATSLDFLTADERFVIENELDWISQRREFLQSADLVAGYVRYGQEPSGLTQSQVVGLVLLGSLVLGFLIALAGAALAAVEIDRELGTMVAIGAPPSLRRRFIGLQSGYHMLVAAVLATPISFAIVAVIFANDEWMEGVEFHPWAVPFVLVGMPLLIGGATTVLFRSGRPTVSRRLS